MNTEKQQEVALSDLAKAAEEVLNASKELAKSQISTGSQPKVSHPASSTEDQVAGDAIADNGTDYRGGKPRVQDTKLRKALLTKLQKGEALTEIEQMMVQDIFAKAQDSEEEHEDEAADKKMVEELKSKKDDEKVKKSISKAAEEIPEIDAVPALRTFANEISKGFKDVCERLSLIEKAIPVVSEGLKKSIGDKVDSYANSMEGFNLKHAELSVKIAKNLDSILEEPASGPVPTVTSTDKVCKGIIPTDDADVDYASLAAVMSDVLVSGRAGEYGFTEKDLNKAICNLEQNKQIDPAHAKRFMQ